MSAEARARAVTRLRALMARTVVNGCTDEEELAAARQVARVIEEIDDSDPTALREPADHMRSERQSAEYQMLLEKSTLEGLLKAAIQELALGHINTVSPPRRRPVGQPVQWMRVSDMIEGHLAMAFGIAGSRMARGILAGTIEELIQDGMLPERLAIPVGE